MSQMTSYGTVIEATVTLSKISAFKIQLSHTYSIPLSCLGLLFLPSFTSVFSDDELVGCCDMLVLS